MGQPAGTLQLSAVWHSYKPFNYSLDLASLPQVIHHRSVVQVLHIEIWLWEDIIKFAGTQLRNLFAWYGCGKYSYIGSDYLMASYYQLVTQDSQMVSLGGGTVVGLPITYKPTRPWRIP
jgi:hypothetical protein